MLKPGLLSVTEARRTTLAGRLLFLILCWTAGSLLFELIGLSLCLIGFCSFL